MAEIIRSYKDLRVYQNAFDAAMKIFRISKSFPPEEKYSLTDQIRKASRSVCANISEGWRRRRYKKSFIAKFNDSEGEAAETQVWLDFALKCNYIDAQTYQELDAQYEHILSQLVIMIQTADKWVLR